MMIRQALISVSDKTGVLEFAQALASLGVQILSTGGTAKLLRENGVPVTEVADYTGFPEMLDGRVKTLHPKIHGGILARRDLPPHVATLAQHDIPMIDMVVVNLYPFEKTVAAKACSLEDAIENIDIGGPAMLRSAAKNYSAVTVVCDPADYRQIVTQLQENQCATTEALRYKLAKKVFAHTAHYDAAIVHYLTLEEPKPAIVSSVTSLGSTSSAVYPSRLTLDFEKVQDLRYGENPHQSAAFYRSVKPVAGVLSNYRQVQGKALSYNNLNDADTAWECVKTFAEPACVIVKHANPCGVAVDATVLNAYEKALQTDATSAFGGIVAFNREVDEQTAQAVSRLFVEVVIAPAFSVSAQQVFAAKPNVRLLEIPLSAGFDPHHLKQIGGGLLMQTPDNATITAADLKTVSHKQPTAQQLQDALFAWQVAKFVKSNAIVFSVNRMTLGVGAGQMSRIDSARIAAIKAQHAQFVATEFLWWRPMRFFLFGMGWTWWYRRAHAAWFSQAVHCAIMK